MEKSECKSDAFFSGGFILNVDVMRLNIQTSNINDKSQMMNMKWSVCVCLWTMHGART